MLIPYEGCVVLWPLSLVFLKIKCDTVLGGRRLGHSSSSVPTRMCFAVSNYMYSGRLYITHNEGAKKASFWLVTQHLISGQSFRDLSEFISLAVNLEKLCYYL
jgi:hypothetical protein